MVATELAEKFKYLNRATKHSKIWENHEEYWHQLRLNYSNLSKLVKETDKLISPLILIFCIQYSVFICSSLTYGITLGNSSNFESAYSSYVIGLLIFKMTVVFFSMARLHDHSKVILPIIHDCPTSKFTLEAQRLQYQITNDDIALTGMNFFSIRRDFMLTVNIIN
ncbi:gustatory receptor for sugar taste 64f-like [Aphidius gifuensis]|uniref:gustatory receptor for sugar taste 64f-like n=1 Tax=Aphidius gifuensis TaxID=684658 RepID=UPI001CDCE834|nr:gustatory receptor for sugar taste 64f-like [Aphidius gifuensis]